MPRRAMSLGLSPAIATFSKVIEPSVGRWTPVMILNTVVLPAPLGPIIPTRSCAPICKSNAETAVRPPNLTVHCWRLRSAPAISILGGVRRQFRSLDPGAADWDSSSRQPAEEPLRTQQHQRDQDE